MNSEILKTSRSNNRLSEKKKKKKDKTLSENGELRM